MEVNETRFVLGKAAATRAGSMAGKGGVYASLAGTRVVRGRAPRRAIEDRTVSKTPRIKRAILSTCLMLGVAAGALVSCGPEQTASTTATADFPYGLTQKGAEAFIMKAEAD